MFARTTFMISQTPSSPRTRAHRLLVRSRAEPLDVSSLPLIELSIEPRPRPRPHHNLCLDLDCKLITSILATPLLPPIHLIFIPASPRARLDNLRNLLYRLCPQRVTASSSAPWIKREIE